MDPADDTWGPNAYVDAAIAGVDASRRFRLPRPVLALQPHSGNPRGPIRSPDFVPFRDPPRQSQQPQRRSNLQTLQPTFNLHNQDPFPSRSGPLLRYAPPEQEQSLHRTSGLNSFIGQSHDPFRPRAMFSLPYVPLQQQLPSLQTPKSDAFGTLRSGPFQSEKMTSVTSDSINTQGRERFSNFLPFHHPAPNQQRSFKNQSLDSSVVAEDGFSSPAAQAALRQSQNRNRDLSPHRSHDVTVSSASSASSDCVPVTKLVSPSVPTSNPTTRGIPPTKRLAFAHAPPFVNGIQLISPKEKIPDSFQSVFPYSVFNAVQSKCFDSIYTTNDNVVVSAPTGSGKTALLELAICKLVTQKSNENAKIVYIAPTKALCKEKAEQWRKKFAMTNMVVSELTGDTSRAEMRTVRAAKIIVTTPEKWDSITRSWKDHRKLLDLVELFLIDEVHILKESRGATLEAVVSRMKTYGAKVRFIALSATVPNSSDIATWLGKEHQNSSIAAHREVFGEQFRPVKLQKIVHGIEGKLGDYPFDKYLNSQLWKYIEMHTQKKPMLVFCMTRKSCHEAAEELAKQWGQRQPHARLWPEPKKRIPVIDASLQEIVRYGVAFHHAGLCADDRQAVHQAFEEGHLSVICCTSTLAVGINLPCHTVMLKGTVCYQDGGQLSEYSDLEVMQMLGRAGRPQYEDSALAIILTRSHNKKRYEELESGKQILESTLHKNLIEHVNSEISLGTFQDAEGAKLWLSGTFLSIRLRQNPRYYGELIDRKSLLGTRRMKAVEDQLEHICEAAINNLRATGLISGDAKFQHTDYGRAMSKYMIRFETMKLILQIPRGAKLQDMLKTLCEASEFNEIRWQANEKDIFRDINKDPFIMYPVQGNIVTVSHKVFLLTQMELGHVEPTNINGFARQRLRGESRRVLEVMRRLIRAVIECKGSDADGLACWAALELARSVTAKAWEGRPVQLLQVPQLGPVLMRKLVAHDIRTVHQLVDSDAASIERIASRNPPYGKRLKDSIAFFPKLTLTIAVKRSKAEPDGKAVVHVDALLGFSHAMGKWLGKIPIVTFLAITTEGVSAHFYRESLSNFKQGERSSHQIHFTWTPSVVTETLVCRFACEEIVGTVVCTEIRHNIPASALSHSAKEDHSRPAGLHRNTSGWKLHALSPCKDEGNNEVKDEVDDDDMLELWDELAPALIHDSSCEIKSNMNDNIKSDIDDDDLCAMLDRNEGLEHNPKKPSRAGQQLKVENLGGSDDQDLSKFTPSSCTVFQRAKIDDKQPQLRGVQEQNLCKINDGKKAAEQPIRLPNGRYKCGHSCSQTHGGTTVRGVKCGHECCRNGSKHPPKKHPNAGKKKDRSGEADISQSGAVPDFSGMQPSRKCARATESSNSTFKPKPSVLTQPFVEPRASLVAPKTDLSLYDIDEDGMIDLTEDYKPVISFSRHNGAETTSGAGNCATMEVMAGKTSVRTDHGLEDVLDDSDNYDDYYDDFMGADIEMEANRVKKREREVMLQKRSNKPAESDNFMTFTPLENATRNSDRRERGEPQNKIRKTQIESIERAHGYGYQGKDRKAGPFQLNALENTSSPTTPSEETGPEEVPHGVLQEDSTTRRQVRRKSEMLLSSDAVTSVKPPQKLDTDDSKALHQKEDAEPRWVHDFDPEFISEFRGLVDFI